MAPVISFVGRHNSGKTTLLTKIICIFRQKGIRTAVIKHAGSGLEITGDSDSERLFRSGASLVYAAADDMSVIYRREKEITPDSICAQIGSFADIIICEGFKKEPFPKIEVLRRETSPYLLDLDNVIARVADFPVNGDFPLYTFDQHEEIANFIINYINL